MKKRGELEEWLRKIFFGGKKEEYVVYIKFRVNGEEQLRPIPGEFITDVRHGCIYVGSDVIPLHRVVEIRNKKGDLLYKRESKSS